MGKEIVALAILTLKHKNFTATKTQFQYMM